MKIISSYIIYRCLTGKKQHKNKMTPLEQVHEECKTIFHNSLLNYQKVFPKQKFNGRSTHGIFIFVLQLTFLISKIKRSIKTANVT